jgi:hypothetical protein
MLRVSTVRTSGARVLNLLGDIGPNEFSRLHKTEGSVLSAGQIDHVSQRAIRPTHSPHLRIGSVRYNVNAMPALPTDQFIALTLPFDLIDQETHYWLRGCR